MKDVKFYYLLLFCLCSLGLWAQDEPTWPERTLVFDMDYEGSKYYRIPALTVTADNALIAIADKRGDQLGDLPNTISIVAKRSTDNGRTWGETVTIAQGGNGKTYGDPAVVQDKEGNLLCIFAGDNGLWNSTPSAKINIYTSKSTDHGRTWSEPRSISDQIYQSGWYGSFAGSGNALRLKDGRLMFVVATRLTATWGGELTNFACYSDDNGETWQVSAPVTGKGDEAKVVELEDGRILMSIRNPQKGYRKMAVSADRGETWGEPTLNMDLKDPACNGDIIRYPSTDGQTRLLQSLPASTTTRENVTVYLSYDEGQTWRVKKQLSEGMSAYSSLTVLPDGTIGALVEVGKHDNNPSSTDGMKLYFFRFSLDWLEGGVTPEPEPATGTLTLDGTERYMRIPTADELHPQTDGGYSITCKVKVPRFISGSNMRFVAQRAYTGTNNSATCGFELFGGNSAEQSYSVNISPEGNPWGGHGHAWGEIPYEEDAWTHLTWVYDGVGKISKIYVNGELSGSKNVTFTTSLNSGFDILVGAGYTTIDGAESVPAFFMTGEMDDVRFYNRALTQEEVTADMAAVVDEETPDLIAAYDFADISGTTVPDISGHGHDGVLVNFPDASRTYTVTIDYPDETLGTLSVLNGTAEVASGMKVAGNTRLTVEATAAEGYQLTAVKVNGVALTGNTFTLTEDVEITAEFESAGEAYPYCVPDRLHNDRSARPRDRRVKAITVSGATANGEAVPFEHTLNNASGQTEVFMNERDETIQASQGDRIDISWTHHSPSAEWVHYYVYIDYNQDGTFNEDNELVSYTFYSPTNNANGTNSLGQTASNSAIKTNTPAFTIPADAPVGQTCLRFKVDWNSKNPCGNPSSNNMIGANAGTIVDYTIDIKEAVKYTVTIDENIVGGRLFLSTANSEPVASGTQVPLGTELIVTPIASPNYRLNGILVNGEILNGTRFTVSGNTTVSARFTDKLLLEYDITDGSEMVVSDGATTYPSGSEFDRGTDLTVTITVPEGHEVTAFTVNGEEVKDNLVDNMYVIEDCKESLRLYVTVAVKQFAVTFEKAPEGGTVEVRNETTGRNLNPGELVDYGTELTVCVNPKATYGVSSCLVNGEEKKDELVDNRLSLTVTEAVGLVVEFAEQTYALTWTVEGNGEVRASGTDSGEEFANGVRLTKGSFVTIEMTPGDKCEVKRIVVNDNEIDLENDENLVKETGYWDYYMEMLADTEITVWFTSPTTGLDRLSDGTPIRYEPKTQMLYIPEGAQAAIYSVDGHKVMSVREAATSVANLPNAYYLVKVSLDGDTDTFKFIKE